VLAATMPHCLAAAERRIAALSRVHRVALAGAAVDPARAARLGAVHLDADPVTAGVDLAAEDAATTRVVGSFA
jgi:hypothetical protein